MKTTLFIIAGAAIFLSSCSSGSKMQSSTSNDDLYVAETPTYVQPEPAPQYNSGATEDPSSNNSNYDQNANKEGTNDYYGSDYGYTSHLNQWYAPSIGFSFFSPFYGFSYYNPYYYSPGLSFSFGFGWGSPYSYYNPWYPPYYAYYPWYSPYYSYYPYYNPYYCNDGYYGNNYYYNNSYYGYNGSSSNNTSNDPNGGRLKKMADDVVASTGIDEASSVGTVHQVPLSAEISDGKEVHVDPASSIDTKSDNVVGKDLGVVQTQKADTKGHLPSVAPGIKVNTQNHVPDSKSLGVPSKNYASPRQNAQNKAPRTMAFAPAGQQQFNNVPFNTKNGSSVKVNQQYMNGLQMNGDNENNSKTKNHVKVYASPENSDNQPDIRNDKQSKGEHLNNDNNGRSNMNSGNNSRNDNAGSNSRSSNENRSSNKPPRKN